MEPIISPLAAEDLEEIWHYIAGDSETAASNFIAELLAVIDLLAESPRAGRARASLRKGLRSFPHGQYLVFYEIKDARVKILRVVHGARHLPELFQ